MREAASLIWHVPKYLPLNSSQLSLTHSTDSWMAKHLFKHQCPSRMWAIESAINGIQRIICFNCTPRVRWTWLIRRKKRYIQVKVGPKKRVPHSTRARQRPDQYPYLRAVWHRGLIIHQGAKCAVLYLWKVLLPVRIELNIDPAVSWRWVCPSKKELTLLGSLYANVWENFGTRMSSSDQLGQDYHQN